MLAVAVRPSFQNATISVAFTAAKSFPGTVYCLVTSPGNASAPKSVSVVSSLGQSTTYTSLKDSPVAVAVTGLRAMKSYTAYCYVQLSTGAGSALSEVVSVGRKTFSTPCCKSVAFTAAPVVAFGDVSNYPAGSTSQIFRYALGDAPSTGSITVTPVISPMDGSTDPVAAQPPFAVFRNTSNAAQLTSQFFLVSNDSTTGVFQVSLKIVGSKASEYGVVRETTMVRLQSGSAAQPAPSIASAYFGDSGSFILITFSGDTDFAGITANTWPCATLFSFVGVESVDCVWITKATVKGMFTKLSGDAGTLLYPGGSLTVKSKRIRAMCKKGTVCSRNAPMNATTATVASAKNAIQPSVVLSLPTNLGACSPMAVDLSMSSGNGGRPWRSVTWTVAANNGEPGPVLDALKSNFDPVTKQAVIPAEAFSPAMYTISVTMTNFLNASASQAASIAVSTDPNLPTVTLLGPAVQVVKASVATKLVGAAKLSACAVASSLKYTWSIADSSAPKVALALASTSLDSTKYVLPAYSLAYGTTYTVSLLVQVYSTKSNTLLSSGVGSTSVFVGPGAVIAAVRGGSTRNAPTDKPFTIDASVSTDENYPPGSAAVLTYSWTCTEVATLSPCAFSAPFAATTSALTVPANLLTLGSVYTVTVIAHSADGRVGTASVAVTGVAPGAPTVTAGNKETTFRTDAVLAVTAYLSASGPVNATWSGFFADTPTPLAGAMTPLNKVFKASQVADMCEFPVSFPIGFFTPGRTYTFRLTAWPVADRTMTARADVVLVANSPPVGGFLTVSPTRGTALSTPFVIATSGWTDDSDLPLQYDFKYNVAVSNLIPPLTIRGIGPVSSTNSSLPEPHPDRARPRHLSGRLQHHGLRHRPPEPVVQPDQVPRRRHGHRARLGQRGRRLRPDQHGLLLAERHQLLHGAQLRCPGAQSVSGHAQHVRRVCGWVRGSHRGFQRQVPQCQLYHRGHRRQVQARGRLPVECVQWGEVCGAQPDVSEWRPDDGLQRARDVQVLRPVGQPLRRRVRDHQHLLQGQVSVSGGLRGQ